MSTTLSSFVTKHDPSFTLDGSRVKHQSRSLARHARQIFQRLHGTTPEAYIKAHRDAAFGGQMPHPLEIAFDIRNHDPLCTGRCERCQGPLQHDGAARYCAYCDRANKGA